jgi:ClpP class serine protease
MIRKKRKIPFPTASMQAFVAAPPAAAGADFLIFESPVAESFEMCGDLAVVDICGPLTQHASLVFDGGFIAHPMSYDEIRAKVLAALASDAKGVVLRIDSPGGDFAGCLELSKAIRAAALAAEKRVCAYTDSIALSAGYALACAASEIYITTSAFVGSVGVWAPLQDQTALDRAMGLNIAIVSSGEQKAERNPHVPITETSIANLQEEVNAMAALFFATVAEQRGLPVERVVALQGSQQFGNQALQSGLADYVVNDWAAFLKTAGERPMAQSLKEMRAGYRSSLAKKAAEDSDEGREAASELSAWDKEEMKKSKKAEGDKEKEEAAAAASAKSDVGDGDGDKEKEEASAKAKAEEDEKEKQAKAAAQASGTTADTVALAALAKVSALEAQLSTERSERVRAELLATRPDFSADIKGWLATASIDVVKQACATIPKAGNPHQASVNAQFPKATQGGASDPGGETIERETISGYFDRKLGVGATAGLGVKRTAFTSELGFMTPAEAQAFLASVEKQEVK